MIRRWTITLFVVFLIGEAMAQMMRTGNLKVRVTFTDGRPCNIKVRVQLMVSAGNTPRRRELHERRRAY